MEMTDRWCFTGEQKMEEKNTDKLLFPLSYDADLKETDDLKIYYQYLDEAFAEPRICNMAVSGSHGIGKSSILHSYDKKRQQRRDEEKNAFEKWIFKIPVLRKCKKHKRQIQTEPHFLYVSLGKYINDDTEKESKEKNIIERRILLQIYARFHKRDIEAGRFDMIQEPSCFGRLNANLGGLLILMILLLIFYQPLGSLIKSVVGKSCLLLKWKTQIHIFLYLIVFVAVVVIGRHLIYYMLTQMCLKNIAVKSDNTEIDIERSACEDYLDLYATELIYCLEQIADKVDRTVVFEDMDRLNQKDCIEIFSRLREINYMLNQRLQGEKYVRFIYVIKDEVLNELQHAKFFDYILPIVPGMNKRSSEDIFRENLKKVNKKLRELYGEAYEEAYGEILINTILFYTERSAEKSLVYMAAPYIKDYRMQYAILNDYGLFFGLYYKNNIKRLKVSKFKDMAEQILALAIYKNIWPQYYGKVTSGESIELFPTNVAKNKKLAEVLVDSRYQFLTYENLCYLGYSRDKLIYNITNYIKGEKVYRNQIEVISSFPGDEVHVVAINEFVDLEIPKNETDSNIEEISRLLAEIVRYYVRCDRVFESRVLDKRDIHLCLRTLTFLDEEEWCEYINKVKNEVYWLLDPEAGDIFDVFKNCLNVEFIATRTDWTEKEIEIFVYGTNDTEKYKGIRLHVKDSDGKPMVIDLEESIRQRKIQKVVPNITA